ncbi:MAG: RDD family protein, partial [Desulfobacteraceae bacterium]
MVWYYKVGDQENGPVSKAKLQMLIKSKAVSAQTMVKNVEMDGWFPLIDVVRGKAVPPQSPPPTDDLFLKDTQVVEDTTGIGFEEQTVEEKGEAEAVDNDNKEMAVSGNAGAESTVICSQCGRFFPEDQVILFESQLICAACKPLFVQKLKEGVVLPGIQNYGGFWIRFLAKIIDGVILSIAQWVIMIPVSMMIMPTMMQSGDQFITPGFFMFMGIQVLIGVSVPLAYTTFMLGRFGATLGKMACGLQVVTPYIDKITYMRALGRFFAEMVSYIILGIGYIMAAFDDEKRTLHDRICSTRVVKKR